MPKIFRLLENVVKADGVKEYHAPRYLEKKAEGKVWTICLIEGGMSINKNFYPKEALRKAIPMFEGVKVFAHKYGDTLDHRPDEMTNPVGLIGNQVGFVKNVRLEEAGEGRLIGDFHVTSSATKDILANTWEADMSQMPGFSVDVYCEGEKRGEVSYVKEFKSVNSLDIVTSPSAGGQFERLVASKNKKESAMNKLLSLLLGMARSGIIATKESITGIEDEKALKILESEFGITAEMGSWDDAKVGEFVKTLLKPKESAPVDPAPVTPAPVKESAHFDKRFSDMQKQMDQNASSIALEGVLSKESKLSDESKGRIRESMKGKVYDVAAAYDAVKAEKTYLEHILESASTGAGASFVKVTSAPMDKMAAALDVMVDPELKGQKGYEGVDGFRSIKEAVRRMDGLNIDDMVSASNADRRRMKESTTANFTVTLGDSMNKRLVREYNFMREREVWTKFVTEEDFTNLNEQKLLRLGGFQDLDTVAENGTYQETNTPSEVNPVYTPFKKGNKFTLTEEMLINDDLRALRMFPSGMARAAVRTLSKFVFDLLTGCDGSDNINIKTIYDLKALYHNDHGGNISTSALSAATLDAAVAVMMNQVQDTGSEDPIGIRSKFLVVPPTLRRTAWDAAVNPLIQANANGGSIQNAIKEYGIEPLVVPEGYLGFRKNAWFLIGDPMDAEGIRIGYHAGKRSPEILLQDQPTVAGVFTNDQITYRVKFRYGGAVVDYRPFFGGIVNT